MQGVIFIGDELTATGFRLAGCDVITEYGDNISLHFEKACTEYALVMVTAGFARQ